MSNVTSNIHHAAMRLFAETGGSTVAISDLAKEAGLSRGTIYNNLDDSSVLLDSVCDMVAEEFLQSMSAAVAAFEDPAQRLANIVRLATRRTHEEPHWGRFIARYGMARPKLGEFWGVLPAQELRRGLAAGRFAFRTEQVASITAAAGGATFGAMTLVLHGHRTWRQAGSDTAELLLRSIGIDQIEARRLSQTEFDPLPRMSVFDLG